MPNRQNTITIKKILSTLHENEKIEPSYSSSYRVQQLDSRKIMQQAPANKTLKALEKDPVIPV